MTTPAQNPPNGLSPFEFQSHQPHSLRAIADEHGEPWFIAKDVATILDYSDAHKMCLHLDDAQKQVRQIGGFGPRGVITINEPGLFIAIINSQKPALKPITDKMARARPLQGRMSGERGRPMMLFSRRRGN